MDILTYTGIFMDPLSPGEADLSIHDIAHALSMLCRANGHFPEIHTVGQHSLECCEEAAARGLSSELCLFCLLHDGAEAYMGDFVRPVKACMPAYKEAEKRLLSMIYEKFAGRCPTEEEEKVIKEIDDTMLYFEFLHYTGKECGSPGKGLASQPEFREEFHGDVEKRFLEKYRQLKE